MLTTVIVATPAETVWLNAAVTIGGGTVASFVLALLRRRPTGRSHRSVTGNRSRATDHWPTLVVVVLYPGAFLLSSTTDPRIVGSPLGPLVIVTFAQALLLLGLVLSVFNQPLRIHANDVPPRERTVHLRFALTNRWRWARIAMSGLVAFGIGIAAAVNVDVGIEDAVFTSPRRWSVSRHWPCTHSGSSTW